MNSHSGKKLYGESYFNSQMGGSYRSAVLYAQHLLKIFKPQSVDKVYKMLKIYRVKISAAKKCLKNY